MIQIKCDNCSYGIDHYDGIFCVDCFNKQKDEIRNLKDRIEHLEKEADELAEEVRWRNFI